MPQWRTASIAFPLRQRTARAKAVLEALVQRGVSADRLCCRGFGKRMALVPESASDEQRRGDRKVVIERVTSESLWNYLNQL